MISAIVLGLIIGLCAPSVRYALLLPPIVIALIWCLTFWWAPIEATLPGAQKWHLIYAVIATIAGLFGKAVAVD